jgi:predicted nucleic acid-binding protein
VKIKAINELSPYLADVKALWRSHSATLGRFPDGAFYDYAKQRNILVALNSEEACIGYLIYRRSRGIISIVHLCIGSDWKGKGIARELFNYLRSITKEYYGIALKCRRDFEAYKMWPKLGFVARYDLPGRGREQKDLTFWWYDHGHTNLFTPKLEKESSCLPVVIDANIFIDLQKDVETANESRALLADWLRDSLELYLTDEIYNEINRVKDRKKRDRRRIIASTFPCVPYAPQSFERISESLRSFFPAKMTSSDESDLAQLAKTIASGVQFFVTRDDKLLSYSDKIYEDYGIAIIRPSDLIIKMDEFYRDTEYQPARLVGTELIIRKIQNGEQDLLAEVFQCVSQRETKAEFKNSIRFFLANPQRFDSKLVIKDNIPIALIVYDLQKRGILNIPMLRGGRSPLTATVIRNLVFQAVLESSTEQRILTQITDLYLNELVIGAIQDIGFIETEVGFMKINLPIVGTSTELAQYLEKALDELKINDTIIFSVINLLRSDIISTDIASAISIERFLWPAKIINIDLPTFLVPIRPIWAEYLFDEELSKQNLFPVYTELALNIESVYYRSKSNSGGLRAPGRILWYESFDKAYSGSMHIRACSYLDEVIVGKPKDLFRQYRRLGVYQRKDVFKLAHFDTERDIMALRFSYTELLKAPISWGTMQKALKKEGISSNLQSPILIPSNVFVKFYSSGKRG